MARKSVGRLLSMASGIQRAASGKKESKKDERIRRYTADGKISKKEAKKLQKRGISQSDVQRRYDKDFQSSREAFAVRPMRWRSPGAQGPQYSPLMISRGASKQFGGGYTSSKKSRDRERKPEFEMSDTDQSIQDFQQQQDDMYAQYEQLMIQQAKEAEEQRKQMEIAMRAQAQNAYSASLQPSFQLQGAGTIPKLGAAQQFQRRVGSQFGTASPYTGLAKIQSGMVNA